MGQQVFAQKRDRLKVACAVYFRCTTRASQTVPRAAMEKEAVFRQEWARLLALNHYSPDQIINLDQTGTRLMMQLMIRRVS